jgi:hypothetical protein
MAYREIKMFIASCDQPGCEKEETVYSAEPKLPFKWELKNDGTMICWYCLWRAKQKEELND